MKFERRQLIFFGGIGVLALFLVIAFIYGIKPPKEETDVVSTDLVVWGVFDSERTFETAVRKYERSAPGLRVLYRQMDPATYEQDLVNALAAGRGPDVFMAHNSWLAKHFEKMAPAPESIVPYAAFNEAFPFAVTEDFAPQRTVYAAPLYLDTLAMYYNKDIFDQEGVALPPRTWDELALAVNRLRKVDTVRGTIERAAVALGGTSASVNRANDLVMLLMMQYGARMVDENFSEATFSRSALVSPGMNQSPAKNAVDFYAQFGNPASVYYTWNDDFANSIDAFSEGRAAIMFNYSHQIEAVRRKNPFLRFGVLPMPQVSLDNKLNFPSYWGFAAAAQSLKIDTAWQFISSVTMDPEQSRLYLEASGRPPALRALIQEKENDVDAGVFSQQALTSRSWLRPDNEAVERIFTDMIAAVVRGRIGSQEAVSQAAASVTALIQKSRFMK